MRVLDLFSGIGGFSLGLERAGFKTVAFCEIEPYCRQVLKKHWPKVPIYEDVRTLTATRLAADGIGVDVICGGFPCQDISVAGKGAGINGERSGLWKEYARLIGELRPQYVIVENVAALLGRGLSRVLGDLAKIGYDAEWHCIPASYVGAPHRRDRLWIVAYPRYSGICERGQLFDAFSQMRLLGGVQSNGVSGFQRQEKEVLADPSSIGQQRQRELIQRCCQAPDGEGKANFSISIGICDQWTTEPGLGGVVDGISSKMDGNIDDFKKRNSEKIATEHKKVNTLSDLRGNECLGKTPSGLRKSGFSGDSLRFMSCQSRSEGWPQEGQVSKNLQNMRPGVHAKPQQEAQHLQPILSIGDWATQCDEAVGEVWRIEPNIPRVFSGVSQRADRLKGLGNAVVPQIPEIIGRAILKVAA